MHDQKIALYIKQGKNNIGVIFQFEEVTEMMNW